MGDGIAGNDLGDGGVEEGLVGVGGEDGVDADADGGFEADGA